MPRPPDTYTHSQFTAIDSDDKGETVQCNHCKQWTGNIKTLNRKKEHLLKCTAYAAWRADGNGQDLAPPNRYNKRDSSMTGEEAYTSPYGPPYGDVDAGPSYTPTALRTRNYDLTKAFDEFWDDGEHQKCMRVRCKHCGFVRAKNTTRQAEHLFMCKEFHKSADAQEALASIGAFGSPAGQPTSNANGDIWRGSAPNPNLQAMVQRRNLIKPRPGGGPAGFTPQRPAPAASKPSLATHLLNRVQDSLTAATQQSFLSHAGCGTLSASALNQWLAQEIHISRAIVPFVGGLIYKTRVPEVSNLTQDATFRALDLLCSAVSNMKKELEFLENTKRKYDLQVQAEEPKPATKGLVDLFASASSAQASLLEGLVVLWAIEHCFCRSFLYASNFMSAMPVSSSYSLPSYLTPQGASSANPYANPQSSADNAHITALHEAFVQNWTSPNFSRFVDACKAIVDEVANAQTSGNGMTEMRACERVFRQVAWLWGQIWPEVDGMGEEDDVMADRQNQNHTSENTRNDADADIDAGPSNGKAQEKSIEIGDDDEADADATADSPYGGTGLGVIAAANRAV